MWAEEAPVESVPLWDMQESRFKRQRALQGSHKSNLMRRNIEQVPFWRKYESPHDRNPDVVSSYLRSAESFDIPLRVCCYLFAAPQQHLRKHNLGHESRRGNE